MIDTALFYVFSAVLLFAAFRVITARSPVYAALYLVLAFFNAACVWMLLRAEFLAIVLVLVYVGAVMVLFLFVVMMLDVGSEALREGFWTHFPLAAIVGVVIALEMAAVLMGGFRTADERVVTPVVAQAAGQAAPAAGQVAAQYSNTKELGRLLYTEYLFPLEIAAVILLVAIIAAIALTLRQRKDSKAIDPSIQVRVRASDRLQIIKVPPSRPAPPQPEPAPVVAAAETKP